MQNKNKLYLGWMIGSILVLVLIQLFWLKSVFKDYQTSLKQEAVLLFANTVTDMMDSLVLSKMTPVFIDGVPDTVFVTSQIAKPIIPDTVKKAIRIEVLREENFPEKPGHVNRQIKVITGGNDFQADSLRAIFRPLMQGIDSLGDGRRFTFRMQEESLEAEDIEAKFNQELTSRGYNVQAKVRKHHFLDSIPLLPANVMTLEDIRVPFGTRIQGYLTDYKWFIYRKMIVPSIFAFLVVMFISWALFSMYRNLLKQQKLNLLKNDIISNITHELKTPVSTVSIVLESLENFGANERIDTRKEYIEIAKNELKRLTDMAEKILISSSWEKEEKGLFKEIDLDYILENKIQSFKPILESRLFKFRYEKVGKSFKIIGNEDQIGLVIYNLLDNAIKYSKEEKEIEVNLAETGNKISLKVKDRGIGIPEAYQKEIFEKFIRVPQDDVHDVKGYGLGLAQVSEIVRAHKGKIVLDSQVGQGSVFTVYFQKK